MHIDSIRDIFKQVTYFKKLELQINNSISSDSFNGLLFSDFVLVFKNFKEWATDSNGKILEKSGKKIPVYNYEYIDDIDAIKGYFIQCLEGSEKDFNINNYDGFDYDDVFQFYYNRLFDTEKSDIYLKKIY